MTSKQQTFISTQNEKLHPSKAGLSSVNTAELYEGKCTYFILCRTHGTAASPLKTGQSLIQRQVWSHTLPGRVTPRWQCGVTVGVSVLTCDASYVWRFIPVRGAAGEHTGGEKHWWCVWCELKDWWWKKGEQHMNFLWLAVVGWNTETSGEIWGVNSCSPTCQTVGTSDNDGDSF